MSEVIVIGHKNPDTDSICSAYCYAHLKNRIDPGTKYIAGRCGNLNRQTRFIFNTFGVRAPEFIKDVYPRVGDIMTARVITINANEPIYTAMRNMEELKIRITPVVRDEQVFQGVLTFFELANFYLGEDVSRKPEYLFRAENFEAVLRGSFFKRGAEDEFSAQIQIGAMPFERAASLLGNIDPARTVLVVGKRKDIIDFAVERQMAAIVITGVGNESELDFDFSGYQGWVFMSNLDTAETYRLLIFSTPAKSIMNTHIPSVKKGDYVEPTRDKLLNTGYRGLPVLDGDRLVGIVTRSDIIKRNVKKLILMDHNEMGQAVDGAETADIVEIIDHHRLGTIRTQIPIYVHAKPVGSTCTLVYHLYGYHGVPVSREIASLLMSGVLSDTAILKSPTTTNDDIQAVSELAEIAGLDYQQFSMEMFSSTDSLSVRDPDNVINADFKVYEEYGVSVGIGQVEVVSLDELDDVWKKLKDSLEKIKKEKNLHWALLMVTDIIREDSLLLSTPFQMGENLLRYMPRGNHVYSLSGVLSRKKQLLPEILRVLEEINSSTPGLNTPPAGGE